MNNGTPELSTTFLGQMLESIKPTTLGELVQIEGLSHGTLVWIGSQKEALDKKLIIKEELFGCREDCFKMLQEGGIEEGKAFKLVEKLRKGKKLDKDEVALMKNSKLNKHVIDNMLKIKYLFPEAHNIIIKYYNYQSAWALN